MIAAAAFVVGFVSAMILAYFCFCFFRKITFSVKSPYLPDRKNYPDSKKTVGAVFSVSGGIIVSFLAVSFKLDGENLRKILALVCFCAAMSAVGFAFDKSRYIDGKTTPPRESHQLFAAAVSSLVFCLIFMAAGFDTVVTAPFSKGGVRLGMIFPLVITAGFTVLIFAMKRSGNVNGSEICRTLVYSCGICTVSIFENSLGSPKTIFTAACVGTLCAAAMWTFPKGLFRTDMSEKFCSAAVIVSLCLITDNEGMLIPMTAFELCCLAARPVDAAVYKLTHKRIFNRLPIDGHLKSCGFSQSAIYIVFLIAAVIFTAAATAVRIVVLLYAK